MKIVVINGEPRTGKDEVVKMASQIIGDRVYGLSTVDKVKQIAIQCGWNREKTPEARKFLSDLKQLTTDFCDMAFKDVVKKIACYKKEMDYYRWNTDDCVVFIHSREPEDMMKYINYYRKAGEEVYSLLVRRSEVETENQSNNSDGGVFFFDYDYTIWNNGTLEELRDTVMQFLHAINIDISENS